MSHELIRVDDFRCFDHFLVEVLPGRELEAVDFAKKNLVDGAPLGILVRSSNVRDWSFIGHLNGIRRLEILKDGPDPVRMPNFLDMLDMRYLRLVGFKVDVDFSAMPNLEFIQFTWTDGCIGFADSSNLRRAQIYEYSGNKISVPSLLDELEIIKFRGKLLEFDVPTKLRRFEIYYARRLECPPYGLSVKAIAMKNVGESGFSYTPFPSGVTHLDIDSCAPISDWSFVAGLRDLKVINVSKTKCVEIPGSLVSLLDRLESVALPRDAGWLG